jgi:hypothetical protein
VGREQQHSRRHASLSRAIFRCKSRHGCPGCELRGELAQWNIETTIIVPGAFTSGTNHFANAGKPGDSNRAGEYAAGPTATLGEEIMRGFASTAVPNADITEVANAIVGSLGAPFGKRPFRVHIDPATDGAEVVNGVADRVRLSFFAIWVLLICCIQTPIRQKEQTRRKAQRMDA